MANWSAYGVAFSQLLIDLTATILDGEELLLIAMSTRTPSGAETNKDPFQLNRLADELASRESANPVTEASNSDIPALTVPPPLSHDNEYLTAKEFNVEEFLLSRSYTSLTDLRAELREYLSELKEELVKLLNDDYEAFISLSTDLKDEGARLTRLKTPLGLLKEQVLQSMSELQTIQDSIQSKLKQRAALREEQALLHLLLKLSESVTRLESLLLISSPETEAKVTLESISYPQVLAEDSDSKTRGNKAKHLGRVASEYTQLLYHVAKARSEKCLFVDEIQWRIDRIQATLSSDLDHFFAETLLTLTDKKTTDIERVKVMSDLTECLRTYDALELWSDAEDVLRKEVVRRFVKKTIYPGALVAPHSPIVPHTPFPSTKSVSLAPNSSLPPRTPYTPFTSLISAKQTIIHIGGNDDIDSPYLHFLEGIDDPLAGLYRQITRFVERDLSRIMDIADKVSIKAFSSIASGEGKSTANGRTDEVAGFNILANVIWEEIGRAITDDLGNMVFAAGRPDEFKQHHELSQAFLRSLESLAPSVRDVEAMRQHPVYKDFQQRWQLPVYFQLRWKEIVSRLDEEISGARSEPRFTFEKSAFATTQANAVWVSYSGCWSAEVFIPELCHRFWRLSLQILTRYKTWLEECILQWDSRAVTSSTTDKSFPQSVGQPISRSSTPGPVAESSSAESIALDDQILRQYAAAIGDIRALQKHVLTLWREEISMMLPDVSDDAVDEAAPLQAIEHSLAGISSLAIPMSNQVTTILARRCCEALLPVRSIPSQFRAMSNKRAPTEPSYFVSSILRPVKNFFGINTSEGPGARLREEYLKVYSTEVFEHVSQRYVFYLSAMKKTEESLRRLKKGKKATFSLFGTGNTARDEDGKDEERIRTQMIYDVEAFGRDAESLGVDVEHSESYQALKEMVHTIDAPDS